MYIMVCPIIKTREALYKGGYIPDNEEIGDGLIIMDGAKIYLNDAPTLVALGAYSNVRGKMYGGVEEGVGIDENELRARGILDSLELRKKIRELNVSGGSQIIMKESKKMTPEELIKHEKDLVSKIQGLSKGGPFN